MSPVVGKFVDAVGHCKFIAMGCWLMGFCCISMGVGGEYIWNNNIIIGLAITIRLLQGSASAMINTTAYSYAAQAYPDKVEKVIARLESVSAFGNIFAPVLGSIIFDAVGFEWTFAGFGIAMFPASFLVCILKSPKDVKKAETKIDIDKSDTTSRAHVDTECSVEEANAGLESKSLLKSSVF